MIADVGLLTEKFNNLEILLSDYNALSGRLSAADLELVDETQLILNEREGVITKIKELISEEITADYTGDDKDLQKKIANLCLIQSEIMKREADNKERYKRKYDEVRGELENLQKEKKKLNFYQTTRSADGGTNQKGKQYDMQN
jgi:hypothetical protein